MTLQRVSSCGLAFALACAILPSCSLFVSLDGLSGGGDGGPEIDGAITDGASNEASSPVDAASDSAPVDAGAWQFVTSQAQTVSPAAPLTVDLLSSVQVGDLVIVGCDSGIAGGYITMNGFDSSALALNIVGPHSDGEAYQAEIGWGVATAAISDLKVTATLQNEGAAGFMDCSVNLYRGGAPSASLIEDVKQIGPDDSGNAQCGPIHTAPGGVAYYIAARTSCVGEPFNPDFVQRTGINGNPNGDVVPTDGSVVQSEMMPCNGSTSSWICYMMSLTP